VSPLRAAVRPEHAPGIVDDAPAGSDVAVTVRTDAPVSIRETGPDGADVVAVAVGIDRERPQAVVLVSDVDRREAALRASPASARLPRAGTGEGRQLRRWIAHCLAASLIVDAAAAEGGTAGDDRVAAGGDRAVGSGDRTVAGDLVPAEVSGALGAGSIALAVLADSAAARAFAGALTADVQVEPATVRRLAAGHAHRASRRVRHVVDGRPVNGGRPVAATAADLPAALGAALASAAAGTVLRGPDSAGRVHEVTVLDDRPADLVSDATPGPDDSTENEGQTGAGGPTGPEAQTGPATRTGPVSERGQHDRTVSDALTAARARAFGRWLDGRRELLVHPGVGYEHPADPRQPDTTHRH